MIKQKEIQQLLISLKQDIRDDYRIEGSDTKPGLQVTIACNDDCTGWNYQTGDTSFMGNVYGLPHWAIVDLYRRSNTKELTKNVFKQWEMLIPLEEDNDNNCR